MFSAFLKLPARCVVAVALAVSSALASPDEPKRVLRVAADPNNLPFSNERLEGFENRIAELLAEELGASLEYLWWPQRRGFFRETIGAGRADVVIGVPDGFERVLTTRPYYTSGYVFIQRPGDSPVRSIDDPMLHHLTIGVQLAGDDGVNTPPAHVLSQRGMVKNIRGYTLFGDYGTDSPPSAIVRAVASGEVDVAVAWGPMAAYFARRQATPLTVTPVPPCDCPLFPFEFSISVGVSRKSPELRREINEILERRAADITAILDAYDVPRVSPSTPPAPVHHARR